MVGSTIALKNVPSELHRSLSDAAEVSLISSNAAVHQLWLR